VRIPLLSLVLFSLGLSAAAQTQEGLASWYGPGFHGKRTASGEVYDKEAFTAAHKSLPFGTYIRVRSLDTGAGVVVRINDRGPFVEGRIIDLSEAAARMLGMIQSGTARVSIEVIPKDEALAWRGANPDGSIPREISEAPVPAKSGETGERVRIQVASYAQESNAKATLQRLALSGIDSKIERSGPYYRIIIDNLSVAASREMTQRLEALGYRGCLITTIKP